MLCHSTIIITSHDKVNRRTIPFYASHEGKECLRNTYVEGFLFFLKKLLLLLFWVSNTDTKRLHLFYVECTLNGQIKSHEFNNQALLANLAWQCNHFQMTVTKPTK